MNLSFFVSFFVWLPLISSSTTFNSPSAYFDGISNQAYLDWTDVHGSNYDQSFFLQASSDQSLGAAVHWRLDGERLHLAVAAKAQGWLAFGLSENGGMQGADVVIWETNAPTKLTDAHILDERVPIADDCQDWTLVNSYDVDGFLIFEATRLLDTGDPQDRAIVFNDAQPSTIGSLVIAAWGDTDTISNHGPENRARGQVRWFGTPEANDSSANFAQLMDLHSEGFFEHRAMDHLILTNETQYTPFCMTRDELVALGVPMDNENLSIIGFEPIVDPRAIAHVHHFTVSTDGNQLNQVECSTQGSEISQVYGWAPGEQPTALPDNVGLPFGDRVDAARLRMVIHYDNPAGVAGVQDSSGVRYYYTTKPLEHDLGYMSFGDPLVQKMGDPVGNGVTTHVFECPSSCSSLVLGDEPVTVIRQYIHMHKQGIAAQSAQIRDGEIIRTASVDFFAFDQQGNQAVQQDHFEIRPGDSFQLSCHYDSSPDTVFGLASNEEMCMSGFQYYPAKRILDQAPWVCPYNIPFPACSSTHKEIAASSKSEVNRNFGSSPLGVCSVNTEGALEVSNSPVDDSDVLNEIPVEENGPDASASFSVPSWSTMGWTIFFLGVFRRTRKKEDLVVPLLFEF